MSDIAPGQPAQSVINRRDRGQTFIIARGYFKEMWGKSMKKTTKRLFYAIIFICVLYGLAITEIAAQKVVSAQGEVNLSTATLFPPLPTQTVDENTKVEVLQAQLETMRSYDQRLLETVYWALGLVGTITIGLIAINWFSNRELYNRDKEAIKEELNNKIQQELLAEKNRQHDEITKMFSGEQEKIAVLANTNDVLIENKIKEHLDPIDSQIKSLESNLKSSHKNLILKLHLLEVDILEIEACRWEEKQIYANVLRLNVKILDTAPYNWQKERALDRILSTIKKIDHVEAAYQAELRTSLDQLPPEYASTVRQIIQALEK